MFELYDSTNKIPKDKYELIYKIIIDNYFERNKALLDRKDEIDTKEAYDNWVNTITNTKDYYILLYYLKNKIVAFITFMYIEKGLCLCEVQIQKDYQGKYDILRTMLKEVINNCDKDRSKTIWATINPNNHKSINVFAHIGFENTNGKWYEITYDNLLKWINKN